MINYLREFSAAEIREVLEALEVNLEISFRFSAFLIGLADMFLGDWGKSKVHNFPGMEPAESFCRIPQFPPP